jgi:hypothetical protein
MTNDVHTVGYGRPSKTKGVSIDIAYIFHDYYDHGVSRHKASCDAGSIIWGLGHLFVKEIQYLDRYLKEREHNSFPGCPAIWKNHRSFSALLFEIS